MTPNEIEKIRAAAEAMRASADLGKPEQIGGALNMLVILACDILTELRTMHKHQRTRA